MSKLEELVAKLCPNGVEKYAVEDICDISRGRVMSKDYIKDNVGCYPVFSSQTENNGQLGLISTYDFDGEYLTWTTDGANAGTVFYRQGKFSITNVCGLLKVKVSNVLTKYLYYTLNAEAPAYVNRGMGNPKLMSNVMSRIRVFIPPLQVQEEIIRILDNFTELMTELTAELTARMKQYEYYEYELMKFDNDVDYVRIEDVCRIEKGKTPIQKAIPGEYPLVATTEERQSSESYQFDCPAVCVPLISSRGHGVASISRIYYQEGKFALGNILCAIIPHNTDELSAEFLRYYLFAKKDILLVPLMRGGANVALTTDSLKSVKIPIPPMEQQLELVEKLKIFDELLNSKTIGLPAEIELRTKQYEYYRNKLLTFKELS